MERAGVEHPLREPAQSRAEFGVPEAGAWSRGVFLPFSLGPADEHAGLFEVVEDGLHGLGEPNGFAGDAGGVAFGMGEQPGEHFRAGIDAEEQAHPQQESLGLGGIGRLAHAAEGESSEVGGTAG